MTSPAAESVYYYLAAVEEHPLQPADVIVGFGHFDLRIARTCGDLWQQGLASRILFTGGVGAGSADLGMPEAEAFAIELRKAIPDFPSDCLLVEPHSTNNGENVRFSLEVLQQADISSGSAILVATPFRQRRVNQTWSKVTHGVPSQSAPPKPDLQTDRHIFAHKGEDLIAQLSGEIARLQNYPQRGWIADTAIPSDILTAAANL